VYARNGVMSDWLSLTVPARSRRESMVFQHAERSRWRPGYVSWSDAVNGNVPVLLRNMFAVLRVRLW